MQAAADHPASLVCRASHHPTIRRYAEKDALAIGQEKREMRLILLRLLRVLLQRCCRGSIHRVGSFQGEIQKSLACYATRLRSSETGMTRRFPTFRVRSWPLRASRCKVDCDNVVSRLAVLKSTAKPLGAGGGASLSMSFLRSAGMEPSPHRTFARPGRPSPAACQGRLSG